MRVAVSVEENQGLDSRISHHFGRCPYFVLAEVEGEEVREIQVVENPYYERHQPGMVPAFIQEQGAEVMISGGMGRRAIAIFQDAGVQPVTGAMNTAKEAIQRYVKGELQAAAPCRESEHGHGHRHGHEHGGRGRDKKMGRS